MLSYLIYIQIFRQFIYIFIIIISIGLIIVLNVKGSFENGESVFQVEIIIEIKIIF